MKLPGALFIACLGAAPLCAQQAEPKTEAEKPAAATGSATAEVRTDSPASPPQPGNRHGHALPQPEHKSVAYIGVHTREVPPEVRAQLSLPEGFGLLVEEVVPDSPAKSAGLKKYDVLVRFEDQQLVNLEQLMSLVRAKKVGDVVHLAVITGGKETQVAVTLGEHHFEAAEHPRHHGFHHQDHDAMQEHMERLQHLQREMREYQERFQQWSQGGSNGPVPQAPGFRLPGHGEAPPHGEGPHRHGHKPQTGISIPPGTDVERFKQSQSQSAANVTRRDPSGEYTLRNENGKKTFIAHPTNGQEQSWPVNTDAERQALPEPMRDKLHQLDGAGGGIRIEIKPGPDENAPGNSALKGRDNARPLPPIKPRPTSA